jgi:hypothetical protein
VPDRIALIRAEVSSTTFTQRWYHPWPHIRELFRSTLQMRFRQSAAHADKVLSEGFSSCNSNCKQSVSWQSQGWR